MQTKKLLPLFIVLMSFSAINSMLTRHDDQPTPQEIVFQYDCSDKIFNKVVNFDRKDVISFSQINTIAYANYIDYIDKFQKKISIKIHNQEKNLEKEFVSEYWTSNNQTFNSAQKKRDYAIYTLAETLIEKYTNNFNQILEFKCLVASFQGKNGQSPVDERAIIKHPTICMLVCENQLKPLLKILLPYNPNPNLYTMPWLPESEEETKNLMHYDTYRMNVNNSYFYLANRDWYNKIANEYAKSIKN